MPERNFYMIELVFPICLGGLMSLVFLCSRKRYLQALRYACRKIGRKQGFSLPDLQISFDQIIYFLALPTHLPQVIEAGREDFKIEYDFSSRLFPELQGLKVYIQDQKETFYIAYLPVSQFRLPFLDQLLHSGRITAEDYRLLTIWKLTDPAALKEIRGEVHKQIHQGRYELR